MFRKKGNRLISGNIGAYFWHDHVTSQCMFLGLTENFLLRSPCRIGKPVVLRLSMTLAPTLNKGNIQNVIDFDISPHSASRLQTAYEPSRKYLYGVCKSLGGVIDRQLEPLEQPQSSQAMSIALFLNDTIGTTLSAERQPRKNDFPFFFPVITDFLFLPP